MKTMCSLKHVRGITGRADASEYDFLSFSLLFEQKFLRLKNQNQKAELLQSDRLYLLVPLFCAVDWQLNLHV